MRQNKKEVQADLSVLVRGFEHIDQAVVLASLDRTILGLNKKARELFNYSSEELKHKSTCVLYSEEEEFYRLGTSRYNPNAKSTSENINVRYRTKFGNEFIGKTHGGVIKDERGMNICFVALISDESARLAAEEALNKLHLITSSRHLTFKQRVDAILKLGTELFGLPIGIFSEINNNKYIIRQATHPKNSLDEGMTFDLSGTYCSHVYEANDVQGFNHVSTSEVASHPCFINFGLEAYLGAPIFVDGTRFGTLNFSSPKPCRPFIRQDYELVKLFSEWVGHEIGRDNDIKALERANKQMNTIANTDSLTRLANRRFTEQTLCELLQSSLRLEKDLSIAIIDFDHFKQINDQHGHSTGDQALQLFSELVSSNSRNSDFYGRWGGEEFLAIFPNTGIQGASVILERLMSQLSTSSINHNNAPIQLSVSIGLTSINTEDNKDTLLLRADKLLYKAKQNGRNQLQHD
ncbi:diguanylate cyclase [Photobacterium rosenbergii]|nr:diguanylate cyclase [Photobacterium rosenbergii]